MVGYYEMREFPPLLLLLLASFIERLLCPKLHAGPLPSLVHYPAKLVVVPSEEETQNNF